MPYVAYYMYNNILTLSQSVFTLSPKCCMIDYFSIVFQLINTLTNIGFTVNIINEYSIVSNYFNISKLWSYSISLRAKLC